MRWASSSSEKKSLPASWNTSLIATPCGVAKNTTSHLSSWAAAGSTTAAWRMITIRSPARSLTVRDWRAAGQPWSQTVSAPARRELTSVAGQLPTRAKVTYLYDETAVEPGTIERAIELNGVAIAADYFHIGVSNLTLKFLGVLTIGFARRFATYKRPNLLLSDPERLARILNGAGRPRSIGSAAHSRWCRYDGSSAVSLGPAASTRSSSC